MRRSELGGHPGPKQSICSTCLYYIRGVRQVSADGGREPRFISAELCRFVDGFPDIFSAAGPALFRPTRAEARRALGLVLKNISKIYSSDATRVGEGQHSSA